MADVKVTTWDDVAKELVRRGVRPGSREYESARKQYESLVISGLLAPHGESVAEKAQSVPDEESPGSTTEVTTTTPPESTKGMWESFKYGLQQGTVPLLLQKTGVIDEPKEKNVEGFLNRLAYGAGSLTTSPELYIPTPGATVAWGTRLAKLATKSPWLAGMLWRGAPMAARFGVHGGLQGGLREGPTVAAAEAGKGAISGFAGGSLGALAKYKTLQKLLPEEKAPQAVVESARRVANAVALPAEVVGFTVPSQAISALETAGPDDSAKDVAKRFAKGTAEAAGENLALIGLSNLLLRGGSSAAAALIARRARLQAEQQARAAAASSAKQKPVEAEQKPVEVEQKPVEAEQKPVEVEQKPVEGEQKPKEAQHTGEGPGDPTQDANVQPQKASISEIQQNVIKVVRKQIADLNAEINAIEGQLKKMSQDNPLFGPLQQKIDELTSQKTLLQEELRNLGASPQEGAPPGKRPPGEEPPSPQGATPPQKPPPQGPPPPQAAAPQGPPPQGPPPPQAVVPQGMPPPRAVPPGPVDIEVPPPIPPGPPKPPQAAPPPKPPRPPKAEGAPSKPVEKVAEAAKERLEAFVTLKPEDVLKVADTLGVSAKDIVVRLGGTTRRVAGETVVAFPQSAREYFESSAGLLKLKNTLLANAPKVRHSQLSGPKEQVPSSPKAQPAGSPAEAATDTNATSLWRYMRDRMAKEAGGDLMVQAPKKIEGTNKYVIDAVRVVGDEQLPVGQIIMAPDGIQSIVAGKNLDKTGNTMYSKFKTAALEGMSELNVGAVNKAAGGKQKVVEVVPGAEALEQRPGEGQKVSPPGGKPEQGAKGGPPAVLRPSRRVARKAKERNKQE